MRKVSSCPTMNGNLGDDLTIVDNSPSSSLHWRTRGQELDHKLCIGSLSSSATPRFSFLLGEAWRGRPSTRPSAATLRSLCFRGVRNRAQPNSTSRVYVGSTAPGIRTAAHSLQVLGLGFCSRRIGGVASPDSRSGRRRLRGLAEGGSRWAPPLRCRRVDRREEWLVRS